jgi:putative endonuclease
MPWYVYILECKNKALYTGITTDLKRRFAEHRSGRGARYTRANVPRKVVYRETCKTRSRALKREAAIKKLPRAKKLELMLK